MELMQGGRMPERDFAALLKSFATPDNAVTLMLLERLPRCVVQPDQRQDLLLFSTLNTTIDIASYTSGRLFHVYGELRWEKQGGCIQVVYTGQSAYLPAFDKEQEETLSACRAVTRRYFLFGKKFDRPELGTQPGDFAEVRIPRLLRYPVLPGLADAQYIQLATCEYRDPNTGANVAYRFKKLLRGKQASREGAQGQ